MAEQLNLEAWMMFGRFQPPTRAHFKLFNQLPNPYLDRGRVPESFVFVSPTFGDKDNPLTLQERMELLKRTDSITNFIGDPEIRNPFEALCYLGRQGYLHVNFLVGKDRTDKYESFKKYLLCGGPHEIPGLVSLNIVPFGEERTEEGISSSRARKAAVSGNEQEFRDMIPHCSYVDVFGKLHSDDSQIIEVLLSGLIKTRVENPIKK